MGPSRRPDPAHAQKNGFRDNGAPSVDEDDPDEVTLRNVRFAQYVLANKGSYVPSPDALRELGKAKTPPVETVESVSAQIRRLKKEHARDLEQLFAFQLSEYHQELVDHRICHDVSAYIDIDEAYPDQVAFRDALQDLDRRVLKMDRLKRDMDDAVSTLRYTYLKRLLLLVKRRNGLRAEDKTARQKRDAWFPQTASQYHHITERDVQLRVARFLAGSTTEQEKMMDEYQWPYRAVQPLLTEYRSNPSFKSEVGGALAALHVVDPRQRPPTRRQGDDAPVFTRFSPVS